MQTGGSRPRFPDARSSSEQGKAPKSGEQLQLYRCKECGHVHEITPELYEQMLRSGASSMNCPHCGEYAKHKKVTDKDKALAKAEES